MSRPRRSCLWSIEPADDSLAWCPKVRRWVRVGEQPKGAGIQSWRTCFTRSSALRAATTLARLGGGEIVRESFRYLPERGRRGRVSTVYLVQPTREAP